MSTLEDRFRDILVSSLNVDEPKNLRDLAVELALEARDWLRDELAASWLTAESQAERQAWLASLDKFHEEWKAK